MDLNGLSILGHMRSKPMGKVRRRVQDLRIAPSFSSSSSSSTSSSSFSDPSAVGADLDLSHNESARLATDCLLSCGLQEYRKMLDAEGEVDFLSDQEKSYILANVKHGRAADADEDEDDEELEKLSADSLTQCHAVCTDSDSLTPTLDLGRVNDGGWSDPVLGPPSVDVYFQSDNGAACMKDLVREFIRKASRSLAIVMDTFSDAELLCDLLEASRKRNVSIHLLLDHLNLNLFSSMCQDLNIDSKHFSKILVCSVNGQTYCAKTGRKLTGQITESFIITDWTEVLTGTYSFSWLSWQVHRSFAVLLTGGAVTPFHQEFLRLYASSEPIPSFSAAPQSILKVNPRKTYWDLSTQHAQTNMEALMQNKSQSQAQTEPLIQNQSQIPNHLKHLDQTKVPYGSFDSITDMGAKRTVSVQDSNPLFTDSPGLTSIQTYEQEQKNRLRSCTENKMQDIHYKLTSKPNLNLDASAHLIVGATGLFSQEISRYNRPMLSGIAVGLNLLGRQRNDALTMTIKADPLSSPSQVPSSFNSQQVQTGADHQCSSTQIRSLTPWLEIQKSSLRAKRQVFPQRILQSHCQTQLRVERPDTNSSSVRTGTIMQSHLQPHLDTLPTMGTKRQVQPNCQLFTPQSYATRTTPVVRHRSFASTYGTGQMTGGQLSSRPFQSNVVMSLSRTNGLTDRHNALFKGSLLNQNISKS